MMIVEDWDVVNIEEDESILMVGITLYFADNFQGGR